MNLKGQTFSIRQMQTHDGPGLRTTVFMKGCSLRCAWCHNPESWSADREIWRDESKCIRCGLCATAEGTLTDHDHWNGDLGVVEACPSKALEALRTDWSLEGLLSRIDRDAYFIGNGGVTVSGGEPALQASFVAALLKACRERGLHTALDTCGAAPPQAFDTILPHCNLVLFDLKIMSAAGHLKWTGQSNELILKNLRRIAENSAADLWIRTPLIPGATDSVENISAIGRWLQSELGARVARWELCSFNNLCVDKYRQLGVEWPFADAPLLDRPHGLRLLETARNFFENVSLRGRFA